MAENNLIAVLKKSRIFNGLDDAEIDKVCDIIKPSEKEYVKNQIIVSQGEPVRKIGVLKRGSAISIKYHFDGNTQILRIYNEGEVFSLDTVNTSLATSPVTLMSQTDTVIVFIPYAAILEADSIETSVKEKIMTNCSEILSNELIRLMYKIDVLSKRTLRDRILTYLSLISERSGSKTFHIGMNQEEFAQYLCVNRSVLSNELNKLRKSGLIDYKGGRFTLRK